MLGALQYVLVRKLGEGPTAEVLLVRAPDATQRVLKVFGRQGTPEPAATARFLKQVELCRAAQHPRVVRCFESGVLPDGRPFLVLEPLEGEDLAGHLRARGPLSPAELVRLLVPLCEALDDLIERGVLYTQLRPNDVFLVGGLSQFQPKLLDVGRVHFGGYGPTRPPECSPDREGDARSVVFAIGVLMYEALEGQAPFISWDEEEWAQRMRFSWSSFRGPSVALLPVIERCLSRDPYQRFANPGELARSLSHSGTPVAITCAAPEPTAPPPLLAEASDTEKVGDVLGNYRLERLLGEGSMGRVFLARHTRLGRTAAIKVMRLEYARNPQFIERFFQEAKSVNQINHEHIVEVFDFVEDRSPQGLGRAYCVMEMLSGCSLTELLQRERMIVRRAVHIARQICTGLDAAHRLGVVHRDIKPDNVFIIDRGGTRDFVKIVDFGVAKVLSPTGAPAAGRTLEGIIIGTPSYMAPEQAAGFRADPRADIYSVGAVLYEMLAGRVPFEGASFGQLMAKVIAQRAPPLNAVSASGEKIPAELAALVMRCLEKDPKRRPGTMGELSGALEPFEAEGSSSPPQRHWRATAGLAGAVVLAAAGLIALVHLPAEPRRSPEPRHSVPSSSGRHFPSSSAFSSEAQLVNVRIASDPPGARVIRADSGAELGTTPLSRSFSRAERDVVLRLELPGHRPIERTIHPADRSTVEVKMAPIKSSGPQRKRALKSERIGRDGLIDPFAE